MAGWQIFTAFTHGTHLWERTLVNCNVSGFTNSIWFYWSLECHNILLRPPDMLHCVSLIASTVLEEMLEVINEHRTLHRKHLHILLQEQIQNLNLSFGIGDSYHGFEFMKERCKVMDIKSYHLLDYDKFYCNRNLNHASFKFSQRRERR
jgi:hypothetical protein